MITAGWLVCYECEGQKTVPYGDTFLPCPRCGGTGRPIPGSYEGTPETPQLEACETDPLEQEWMPGYDVTDRAK